MPAAADLQGAIERFLKTARQPALLEPGSELLPLAAGNFVLEMKNSRLLLQAWDEKRNLVRRVTGIRAETRGRLELVVERFARREGELALVDLGHPRAHHEERRSTRLVFREQFRQMLRREFPEWKLAELSAEADLEHSLSPSYARALLRRGQSAWAAIGAPADSAATDGILSFGLIWLDYLRHRERRLAVEGLYLFLPSGHERPTSLRMPFLDPRAGRCEIFTYAPQGFTARLDPRDFGNIDTRLEACCRPIDTAELPAGPEIERVPRHDGSVSLRVRGLEFARATSNDVLFGLEQRVPLRDHNRGEMQQLAAFLAQRRGPAAADRDHPLYRRNPEAWLESRVRAQIDRVDASLLPEPVYAQVPAFAGGERGIPDLLAVDRCGRLTVLELKASADLHLPLQALDYWMRVKWHLDREEFSRHGYFPGISLRRDPPRLLLLSPALEFHPTTEALLGFFSREIDVERIGLAVEWRKELDVMFRLRGSDRPLC